MLNLQRVFLAWLLAFKETAVAAKTDKFTDESLQPWVEHFNNVTMHFTHIDGGPTYRAKLVYKMQESDEQSATDIGHSTLARAREPSHFFMTAANSYGEACSMLAD